MPIGHRTLTALALAAVACLGWPPATAAAPAAAPAPVAGVPNISAQKAALGKLSFLHGRWTGENRATQADGSVVVTAAEDEIAPLLDGTILAIKGRAYAPGQKPGGAYTGENYGILAFNDKTGRLEITAYANGGVLTGEGTITGQNAAEWTLEGPAVYVRFTARADGPDGWIETGEFSRDRGASWGGKFEIVFKRAK